MSFWAKYTSNADNTDLIYQLNDLNNHGNVKANADLSDLKSFFNLKIFSKS